MYFVEGWDLLFLHRSICKKVFLLGLCPKNECCSDTGCECIVSSLDMKRVCYDVNTANCGVESIVSDDPGRYASTHFFHSHPRQTIQIKSCWLKIPVWFYLLPIAQHQPILQFVHSRTTSWKAIHGRAAGARHPTSYSIDVDTAWPGVVVTLRFLLISGRMLI